MSKNLTLWSRIRQLPSVVRNVLFAEGSWRGPFSGLGELGNVFGMTYLQDGWQNNLQLSSRNAEDFGPVYSCIAILSQELSRIPIKHYAIADDGRRTEVKNKAPFRVLRNPNKYQTISDFLLYVKRSLLLEGNGYAVAERNNRFEVTALHPVNPYQMYPYIIDGEVFYRFGDPVTAQLLNIEEDNAIAWFPARDVFHIRMHCPKHPLIGESPLTAALFPANTGMQINTHTLKFFHNLSRPSGVLRHPGTLTDDAMERIKQRFVQLTQANQYGAPLVLQENMDWKPLTMSAVDAELVNSYKLTERQIAQVFRIPPFLLGELEKATFQNVESLVRFFIQSSLGFYVNHFENALTKFFELPADEYIHFDVEGALLRTDLKERMDAYAKAIQSGVYAPNEARARESLPPVEYGDAPRVQQQLVPLEYGMNLQPPSGTESVEPTEPEETEEQRLAAEIIARRAIEKAMKS